MTFKQFYRGMIEYDPPDPLKIREVLLRILSILSRRTPKALPPPRGQGEP